MRSRLQIILLTSATLMSGCAVGPDYQAPVVALPAAFQQKPVGRPKPISPLLAGGTVSTIHS